MKRFALSLLCGAALLASLTACSAGEGSVTAGEAVYGSSYKIKSIVTDTDTSAKGTFEVQVDGEGNGQGLLGINDIVYDVILSNHEVYVKLEDNNYVYIYDLSDKFTFNVSLPDLKKKSDMESAGFTYSNGEVISYAFTADGLDISTKYQRVENSYNSVSVSRENSMGLDEFIAYANKFSEEKIDQAADIGSAVVESQPVEEEPEKPVAASFYANSDLGVTIDGKKFSVGDYVNPDTYFFNLVPEGMSTNYEYDQDNRVEVRYYSYLDTTGRVEFETIDGDVYGILAYCDCSWLKFSTGMAQSEIDTLLGVKWNERKQGEFKPIRSDIEVVSTKSNTYIVKCGDITAELRCKDKTLNAIYVYKERLYRDYNS